MLSLGGGTHRAALVLQQLQAAFALFQLLVDAQLLLLRPLVALAKRQKLRLGVFILHTHTHTQSSCCGTVNSGMLNFSRA